MVQSKLAMGFLCAAILTMAATGARADYSEEFDSYAAGSQILDQADWIPWANDTGDASNGGAFVSNAEASSGANSLAVGGIPDLNTDVVWQFGPINSGTWTFTANTFIPGSSVTGEQDICWMAIHPGDGGYDPPNGIDWVGGPIMALHLDTGKATGQDALTDPNNPVNIELDIVKDAWKEIKIVTDVDALTCKTYYDGTLCDQRLWDGPNQIEALDLWVAAPSDVMYYDDLKLVPEPATLSLLGLGGLCLLLTYIRRRRTV